MIARFSVVTSTRYRPHPLSALLNDRRVRYVVAGSVGALGYYTLFSGGWLLLGPRVPYLLIAVVANAVNAVLTYPLYRRLVFRRSGPWLAGLVRFYVICLWSLFVTLAGLPLLVEFAGLHVLVAQALIIIGTPLINYQLHRFWAFRDRS